MISERLEKVLVNAMGTINEQRRKEDSILTHSESRRIRKIEELLWYVTRECEGSRDEKAEAEAEAGS